MGRFTLDVDIDIDPPSIPELSRKPVPIWMMPNSGLGPNVSRIASEQAWLDATLVVDRPVEPAAQFHVRARAGILRTASMTA